MESLLQNGDSWSVGLNSYESTLWAFCPFGSHWVLFERTTHVEPQADDFRTRVRVPPPPPKKESLPTGGSFFWWGVSGTSTHGFDKFAGAKFERPSGRPAGWRAGARHTIRRSKQRRSRCAIVRKRRSSNERPSGRPAGWRAGARHTIRRSKQRRSRCAIGAYLV